MIEENSFVLYDVSVTVMSMFLFHVVAKKMQVPATAGYQAPDISVQALNTMPAQQQAMPGQQAASYYPNTGKVPNSLKRICDSFQAK